jgi:hypothetical protein
MKIYTRYGVQGEKTPFDLILHVFIFGVFSYAILYLIYSYYGWPLEIFDLDINGTNLVDTRVLPEILWATCIGIVGGILSLYFETYKLLTRFVHLIGATHRYGDEDVWDFMFNSQSDATSFVHFRDFENSVTYAGYVEVFSETGKLRELVLVEVVVYDFDGNRMYEVHRLYLARQSDKIHLEFPIISLEQPHVSPAAASYETVDKSG